MKIFTCPLNKNSIVIFYHAAGNSANQNTGRLLYAQWSYTQLYLHAVRMSTCLAHCIFYGIESMGENKLALQCFLVGHHGISHLLVTCVSW